MIEAYEAAMADARASFESDPVVTSVAGGALGVDELERYVMWFAALGTQMTAPVEGWIRRAGERCLALGYHELGDALVKHARHEAGHDALFRADTRALAGRRAACGRSWIDPEILLLHPPTHGVQAYAGLHESVIAGAQPFAQVAIEYEIERLSTVFGPKFIQVCVACLGQDVLGCLTFVTDHVRLDEGHTAFNARQLDRFLAANPEALSALAAAGAAALNAYAAYLADCRSLSLAGLTA